MTAPEENDVVYFDDVAYSASDSGGRRWERGPMPAYRTLPIPRDWLGGGRGPTRRASARQPVSRMACLKAALRNFF